ncbi:MAG: hypothetical protein MZV70_51615 [Desulfobacterales bacterium]|nr:hypothetical protein [Desulfobacterales bacterium]
MADQQYRLFGKSGVVRRERQGARAPPPGAGLRGDQVRRPAHRAREPGRGVLLQGQGRGVFGPGRHTLKTGNIPILTKIASIPWAHAEPPAGRGVLRQPEGVHQPQVGDARPGRLQGRRAGAGPPAGLRRVQPPGGPAGPAHQPPGRHPGDVTPPRRSKST